MTANGKPRFAMYWAASCGGCEIAVLNTHEKILDVDAHFDVVFWPVAVDTKYADLEAMEDGSILLTLFNGGIRNDENEHLARLLRRKSQLLVAFGSCANEGCIPGLANLSTPSEIFQAAYESASVDDTAGVQPVPRYRVGEGELNLPYFYPRLKTLDQVVDVDYTIPGCPPESHQIAAVIDTVIAVLHGEGELPPKGSVLGAGQSAVCDECARRREEKAIKAFHRVQDLETIDPDICLLEQGIVCNGPATRSGCLARCPSVGMPCVGCYGPAPGVVDYGGKLISAIASVIDSDDPDEIDAILDGIPDPAGMFYRFNLAHSLLRGRRMETSIAGD